MVLRWTKKVDSNGKIFIPSVIVKNLGKEFILEVQEDKILLIPTKKEK